MPDLSEEDRAAVRSVRASVMRLSRRLRNQRIDTALSTTESSVLGTLARCGPATPGELARKEHVQPPSMTRIIANLEAKSLVRREPHPEDRRQVVVTKTEEADTMLEASRRKRDEWLAVRVEQLTDEEWELLVRAAPVLERLADL
ncbi:MarR family transcriptional regulator [Mangrovactinospora gilvigrisea]|uniref:MarR family transcriptional regulator n=1 Tax=Mangrovactinospora gilvigrisea TaxID=1428644 RepID=A0A1J7C3T5_9ACTN|nr:MarR family transcriptional regulator [Mangrovactinospora gilvigrisea]OIV36216.1 MarR family transcriptional regulator [Mangrovactinospora gilvigrisea]